MKRHSIERQRLALGALLSVLAGGFLLAGCGSSGPAGTSTGTAGSGGTQTFTDLTISGKEVFVGQTLNVSGVVTIPDGAEMDLQGSVLAFSPAAPASQTLLLKGSGKLVAGSSLLKSGNGTTWCMAAEDTSQVILSNTDATGHVGLQFFSDSSLTATACGCGLVQVHDNCGIDLQPETTAAIQLFIQGPVTSSLNSSELVSDTPVTESFNVRTSSTSTAHVTLDEATVFFWQIEASGGSALSLDGARDLTLSLHLSNASQTIGGALTGSGLESGVLDFSASGNPKITYTKSQIRGLALDIAGTSDIQVAGPNTIVAARTSGAARLSLGPGTILAGTLAEARDQSRLSIDRATVAARARSGLSLAARDSAILSLTGVSIPASTRARARAIGGGQVLIDGGSGWAVQILSDLDIIGGGGIYLDGRRLAP